MTDQNLVELLGRYSKLPKPPEFGPFTPRLKSERTPRRVHSARRRLSVDERQQLVADYQAGQPTTALMVTYGLGKGTVLELLREAGVRLRAQGQRNIDLAEAIERYTAGWSLKKLGAAYDCDAETIRKALRAAGISRRSPHG
jgi:hypothetical protein